MKVIFEKRNRLLLIIAVMLSMTAFAIVEKEAGSEPSINFGDSLSVDLSALDPELKPSLGQTRAAEEILHKLQRRHYAKQRFDDDISSRLLDEYLENLDPGKYYFTQTDVDAFEVFRLRLDDGARRGELEPPFFIFQRYRDIATKHLDYTVKNLSRLINDIDFDIDESIAVDGDQLQWPQSEQERRDRLRKSLKAAVLGLRLSDKTDEEIQDTLSKRYANQLSRLQQLNREDVFQLYVNSLTALYDPHTSYMSPRNSENFMIHMSLSLEGIGAVLKQDGEYTVVEELVPGGPADLQGELKPKDKIISVAQGTDKNREDIVGMRLEEVVQLIRGKKGTQVRLEVIGSDAMLSDAQEIVIVRNEVKLEEQAAQSDVIDIFHNEEVKKVGVINVPTFYLDYEAQMRGDKDYRSTTRDVARLLKELEDEGVEGVIIDLQGNGGGYLEEAKSLTGLFVERGPVVQIKQANGKIKSQNNYPNPTWYNKPIVVLIDRLSASASEIFAGAIQDYDRGLVVGSPSFGKGTVQGLTALNHGQLKLTEAKYYRVSGESTQHRGVVPNIQLPSLYDTGDIGEASLENALAWDTVPPQPHRDYGDLEGLAAAIIPMHQQRMVDDPDYAFLQGQIELNDELRAIKELSLNQEKRVEMRESDKRKRLALENRRRVAKGLEPLTEDEESDDEPSGEVSENTEAEDDEEVDPRADFFITEAANILLDAIAIQKSRAPKERVATLLN